MDKIETFEDLLNNKDIKNIVSSVIEKYRYRFKHGYGYVDQDDIESIKLTTLWKCWQNFDPTKSKLTSHIYRNLVFSFKNALKKNDSQLNNFPFERIYVKEDENIEDVKLMLEDLPEKYRKVLTERFFDKMTIKEIAEKNSCSTLTARRRIQKGIEILKEANKVCIN